MWRKLFSHPLFWFCLITFFAYIPSLPNEFVWDDEQFIYKNVFVLQGDIPKILTTSTTAGAGIESNYFRPVTTLTFAIDHAVWGLWPAAFRMTNVLLHILAGILAYFLLRNWGMKLWPASLIAGLFLLHPIQTEAVTYINSRGDSLFALFGLLALLLFSLSLKMQLPKKVSVLGIAYAVSTAQLQMLSVISLVFAVLSKEIALSIVLFYPAIYFYYQYTSIGRSLISDSKVLNHKHVGKGIPTLVTVFIFLFLYLLGRATILNFNDTFSTKLTGEYYTNPAIRIATFSKVFFLYQQSILIPTNLHMEHEIDPETSGITVWLVLLLVLISSLSYSGYLEWKRGEPWIVAGMVWYTLLMAPVSGIIPVNGIMYEHWQYTPILGWGMILYGLLTVLARFPKTFIHRSYWKIIGYFVLVVIVFMYAGLIIRQNYFWSTPIRLYSYILQYTDSSRIHNNLAMAYAEANQFELALAHYNKALEYGAHYPQIYHNLGNLYQNLNQPQDAIEAYSKALTITPDFYYSYDPLYKLLKEYRPEDADAYFESLTGQKVNIE